MKKTDISLHCKEIRSHARLPLTKQSCYNPFIQGIASLHFIPLAMAFLSLFHSNVLLAQKDLKPEEIEVVKDYTPFLADAVKMNFPAEIPDRASSGKLDLIYSAPEKKITVPFEPAPLKPLAIAKEKPEKFPMNYFRLGFGTQWSPLFEALWNDGKYEKYNYGFFAKHFSSRSPKLDFQDHSENHIGVFGNYFSKKAKFSSDLFYHRECVRYYGYDHDTIAYVKDDVKQHYDNFTWKAAVSGIQSRKSFDYSIRFGYTHYGSRSDIKESNPWLKVSLQKVFKTKHFVTLNMLEDHSLFKRDSSASRNIFSIKPMYEFNDQIWRVFGGVDLAWENNIFHFFPELGFERSLYEKYIVTYSGWRMELRRTSYQVLTGVNPWLGENFELHNLWFEDRYIGFKGTVRDFSYDLRSAQKLVRRHPLFVNDPADMKKFTVVYDPKTIILHLHAELFYHITQDLDLSATLEYNHYEMDEEEAKPWHLPNFVFDFNTRYTIKKKVFLSLDLLARDGVVAKLPDGSAVSMGGTCDVNLGATYQHNKHFSFFITLNNLASIKYEKFYMYPSYGFNGLAGATFTY